MSQVLESIRLALSSIWANKLRSLLTLLGNIVAVSSIITVVALITGVNGVTTGSASTAASSTTPRGRASAVC